MNLIDPNQVSDVQSLRNIAETYKLAHESANTRAGEMEFALLDYKRAHGNSQLVIDQLNAQIAQLMARVAYLEETYAPAPGIVSDEEPAAAPPVRGIPLGIIQIDECQAEIAPAPAEESAPSAT